MDASWMKVKKLVAAPQGEPIKAKRMPRDGSSCGIFLRGNGCDESSDDVAKQLTRIMHQALKNAVLAVAQRFEIV
jgi:hypothetical protein